MTDRGLKQLKEPLRQVQKEIRDLLGLLQRGGPGSGHHGHAGRPGEVGGSLPSGEIRDPSIPADIRAMRFFHATDSESGATKRLKSGDIQVGPSAGGEGFLAPVAGRTYATSDLEYALIYALGGNVAGNDVDEWMQKIIDRDGRYGYIFEIDTDSLNNIQPDEDAIGRAIHNETYPWLNRLAEGYLSNKMLNKVMMGEYIYWAKSGKMLVKYMSDSQKHEMIRDGVSIANDGNLKFKNVWRIDKYDLPKYPKINYSEEETPEKKQRRVDKVWELAEPVEIIERHYGPGPHSGTGTPQDVHGGQRGTGYFSWQDRYIEHIPKHMGKRDIPEGMMYQPARWLGLHSEGFGDVFRELAKAHDYTGGRIDWSYIEEKIQRFEKDISYERDKEWIFEGELSPADEGRRKEMLTLWREFPGAMPPVLEVARQLNLRLLERDLTGVILAISDVRSFQKSGALLIRHYGPGPHPGTGTSQDVHGGGRGYRKIPFDNTYATAPIGLRRLAKKEQQETGEFRWAYWDLSDPDDPHTKMFENKEAAMEFIAEKIRELDYEIHYSFSDATMIFEHTQNKPHNINFNSQDILALIELSKRPENTNIMNMHNHPPQKSGIDIPPSFSDFDFAMSQQKTDEWWVVTPNGKYVVTREERGIPYFASADVYQLRDDWNRWTEQNLGNYFPGYDPKHSIQLKASRDPEIGKKYVEMRMELIQKEVEDGGYFNMEWIPNE